MKKRFFNGEELTDETILKTRKFFSDNCLVCIESVKNGKSKVYCDKEEYYQSREKDARDYLNGVHDHTFAFLQKSYFIQTGKSVALLPS